MSSALQTSKKILFCILSVMFIVLSACGCQREDTQPEKELAIWLDSSIYESLQSIWDAFRKENTDVNVSFELLPDPIAKPDNWVLEVSRLRTKIMAGEGPDLFILDSGSFREGFFQDINKAMRNGIFSDMLPMFDDIGVDESSFNPALLEVGRVDGKQFILPLTYHMDSIVSSELLMQKIGYSAFASTDQMLNSICSLMEADGVARPFTPHHGSNTFNFNPYYYTDKPLVDYDSETALIDTPFIRSILASSKMAQDRMSEYILSGEYDAIPQSGEFKEYIQSDKFISVFQYTSYSIGEVSVCNYLDVTPNIDIFPNECGGVSAIVMAYAAVGAKCKNPNNAANMLRLLLGEDLQAGNGNYIRWMTYGFPARNEYTGQYVRNLNTKQNFVDLFLADIGMQPSSTPLSNEIIDHYLDIEARISRACLPPPIEITQIIEQYYRGEIDLDTCIDHMQRYWNISLSE